MAYQSIKMDVEDQIDRAWDLVESAFNQGLDTLNTLGGEVYEVSWTEPTIPTISAPSIFTSSPSSPSVGNVPEVSANFEGTEPIVPDIDIENVVIPEWVEKDYGFNIPTSPNVSWPTFSKDAPAASDIDIPSAPNFDLPEVPSLSSVTIPTPPEYSIPEFEGILPVDDLTEPSLSFNWGESAYSSNLKTKLGDVLYDNLVAGGTGLDETTEQAIYDRAISRLEEEEQSLMDSANDGMASKGFPLPPGAHASRVLETESKILRSREDLNNDVLVQQSKLAQENTHFIIEKAVQLEQVLISYHSDAQNRSMQAAQFVITTAVQQYGLRVEAYKAKLSAYQTMAQVYQVRIQGEIAKAEFYKAQIQGVSVSVDVQRSLIEAYQAQIAGINALMQVYRTQMEGANIQANVDQTRMQGFLSEVQAYVAQVNAATARYDGYKAQISGETAKAEMYRADSEAYLARVQGQKAIADVNVSQAQAQLSRAQAAVEVFNGYIQKYNADVQKEIANAEAIAKKEGLEVDIYKAQSENYASELDSLLKIYLGRIEEVKNKTTLSIRSSEVAVQSLLAQFQLTSENLRAAAQVSGQMASAAAASVNASLSAGFNDSQSESYQESNSNANVNSNINSTSSSTSNSTSSVTEEIHSYSE